MDMFQLYRHVTALRTYAPYRGADVVVLHGGLRGDILKSPAAKSEGDAA